MEVEVAVLLSPGEPFSAPDAISARSGPQVRWVDRPRVSLTAELDWSIGQILECAATELEIALMPHHSHGGTRPVNDAIQGFAFYRDTPDEGTAEISSKWAILDDGQAVRWVTDIKPLSLRQLIAAADSGLLLGDPKRLYLVPYPSQGTVADLDWPAILSSLETVDDVLIHVGGTLAGLQGVRAIVRRGRATVARAWRHIAGRGGAIEDMQKLARRPGWTTADFAALLKISDHDAESFLQLFGCRRADDGTWSPGTDLECRTVNALITTVWFAAECRMAPGDPATRAALFATIEDIADAATDSTPDQDEVAFRAVQRQLGADPPSPSGWTLPN